MLVAGAGNGIGRAAAQRLAAEGATLVLLDREAETVSTVAADLPAAIGWGCDLTSDAAVAAMGTELADRVEHLDAVVTTAGGVTRPLADAVAGVDYWIEQLELNLLSTVRLVAMTLPLLRRASDGAAIAVTSSINGHRGIGQDPYSAAKAGLESYVRTLAARLAPERIRVNAVVPGTVRTRVWDDQPGGFADRGERYPLQRIGDPADVAAALAFLVSEDASWITGQSLRVDGGLSVTSSL